MSGYGPRNGSTASMAASAYRSTGVANRSPAEIVVLLYERLLADLKGAALAIDANDLEAKAARLQRANNIVFELLATLDMDQGEVPQRLAALYSYLITRIGEASRTLDRRILDEVAGLVEGLLSAWQTVARDPAVGEVQRQ